MKPCAGGYSTPCILLKAPYGCEASLKNIMISSVSGYKGAFQDLKRHSRGKCFKTNKQKYPQTFVAEHKNPGESLLLHRNVAEIQCCEVSGLYSLLCFVIWSVEKWSCALDTKVKKRALESRCSFNWWEHIGSSSSHRIVLEMRCLKCSFLPLDRKPCCSWF